MPTFNSLNNNALRFFGAFILKNKGLSHIENEIEIKRF